MSTDTSTPFSFFPSGPARTSNYSLWSVLTLSGDKMNVFWEIWLSILIWMLISYTFVHLMAGVLSLIMLRRHSWMPFLTMPFLVMFLVGPVTLGAITSATIALTYTTASSVIACWLCAVYGVTQTIAVLLVSFSHLLATL
ncbi:hypothetical protein L596_007360 [Steinernema carpocapsae]|uniref:Transmembrane protein 170A n=1 Tax=Steinernema carpocapsae TaxID=34508 RepID=A0A4U5P9G4_STECR|nr:hypothetical protein L596_007360 [Steinernema carpocapsae]